MLRLSTLGLRLLFVFTAGMAYSATWYVDVKATTGLNNGASWANAWTNPLSSDRNSGFVNSGDTVWIAGGDYVSTHGQGWRLKEGTSGNWTHYRFTNGTAKVYCVIIAKEFTELFAGKSPGYETNLVGTYDVPKITNNCNLWIIRRTNWYDVGSGGRSIVVQGAPTILKWIHITGTTNRYATDPPFYRKSDSASEIFYDVGGTTSIHSEAACIWIDQSSGHGGGAAIAIGNDAAEFGCFNIHHSLFENNGSDVCNFSAGVDYHNNIVRNRQGAGYQGCNDTFTISGNTSYIRIYNNLIEPADNTLYYLWGAVSNIHDFYFYGNILTPVRQAYRAQATQGSGIMEQDTLATPKYVIRNNVVFANNTWVGTTNSGPGGLISFISKNGLACGFTIDPGAMIIKNNLAVQIDANALQIPSGVFGFKVASVDGTGFNNLGFGWSYTSNSIILDYNQFSAYRNGNIIAASWGQSGAPKTVLANATDIARVLGYSHNVSDVPVQFVDAPNYDYRPSTSAVNVGQNLSSLTNLMPDLDKDLYGNKRGGNGAWSTGAIEYRPLGGVVTNGLVLWLTFDRSDGWTTNHVISDKSGYGNHAYYMPSTNRNTWPTWTNGPNGLSAAQFVVNLTNSGGFRQGTYAAITSLSTNAAASGLGSFTNGTWACWALVDNAHILGDSGDDLFLSTGQDGNNWFFGKYYSNGPQFSRASTFGGQEPLDTYSRWPNVGTSSGWQHYAITWDGTNFTAYLNGSPYSNSLAWRDSNTFTLTNQYRGVLTSTNSAVPAWSYIAVGVNNHSGTADPDDSDGLPNNGQFWGQLADVRIYKRPLSAQEIGMIYNNSAVSVRLEAPTGFRLISALP